MKENINSAHRDFLKSGSGSLKETDVSRFTEKWLTHSSSRWRKLATRLRIRTRAFVVEDAERPIVGGAVAYTNVFGLSLVFLDRDPRTMDERQSFVLLHELAHTTKHAISYDGYARVF